MRVIVIGASGTLGGAVAQALRGSHEVVAASRNGTPRVDLANPATIAGLFDSVGAADAVVCCAASAPLEPLANLSQERLIETIGPKLIGQVGLAIAAASRLDPGGSITLTSGKIPEQTAGSAPGALVNAGLEAFVRALPVDLDRGIRINAVSPGWVSETLAGMGLDPSDGTPASEIARAYVEAVEGTMQGEVLRPDNR